MAVFKWQRLACDTAFLSTQRKLGDISQSLATHLSIGLPVLSFNGQLFYLRKNKKGEIIMKKWLYKPEMKASL